MQHLKRKIFLLKKWDILRIKVSYDLKYINRDKSLLRNINRNMKRKVRLKNG